MTTKCAESPPIPIMLAVWVIGLAALGLGWVTFVAAPSAQSTGQAAGPAPNAKPAAQQPSAKPSVTEPSSPQHAATDNHGAQSQPAGPADPPPIAFRPSLLDLGTVRPGQPANGSVDVVNTSDRSIKILSSKASCTCTSVNLANTVIAPGESVVLPAEFKGSSKLGPQNLSVRVKVEGFRDLAEVPMRVTVSLPVYANPSNITSMRDPNTGELPLSGIVTIASEDDKPFRILSVQGQTPALVDFDPATDTVRDTYQLKWDLSSYNEKTCVDGRGASMPQWIAVETDHPECGVLDLEVRHECTRRTYLKPGDAWLLDDRRVNIGRVKPGKPIEFTLEAKWLPKGSRTQLPILITSESPQFSVEMTNIVPTDKGFEVHVRLTPNKAHSGLIYGNLRLHSHIQQWPVAVIGTARE